MFQPKRTFTVTLKLLALLLSLLWWAWLYRISGDCAMFRAWVRWAMPKQYVMIGGGT